MYLTLTAFKVHVVKTEAFKDQLQKLVSILESIKSCVIGCIAVICIQSIKTFSSPISALSTTITIGEELLFKVSDSHVQHHENGLN